MQGDYLGLYTCPNCKRLFSACPECVNCIRIDPETGLPPDCEWVDGRLVHNPAPSPEATARAVKTPVCDPCVEKRNGLYVNGGTDVLHIAGMWELAEDRHRRTHT